MHIAQYIIGMVVYILTIQYNLHTVSVKVEQCKHNLVTAKSNAEYAQIIE
jgi:hypothetical protein